MKQFPSFPSFRFLHKGQNRKLENLRNLQLLPAKQRQVFKQFHSFQSFRFLYKGQNRKLGILGNFILPPIKHILWSLQNLKIFASFPWFWFQYKSQNLNLENLGNSKMPQKNKFFEIYILKIFPSFPSCRF